MNSMRLSVGTLATGALFGVVLSRVGFTSWDETHEMFTFQDLRMFLAFCTAVVVLFVAWRVVSAVSKPRWTPRRIHKGTLPGGVLFGVGWAIAGGCPSIAMVQLGEGQLAAVWTLAGIFAGNWLYSVVHERYFRWSTSSCLDL